MGKRKTIIGINGSAGRSSSNHQILKHNYELCQQEFDLTIIDNLSILPHFKTELTEFNTPSEVVDFRDHIANYDGVIFCSPEYVFSVPSRLKNALEWCVSTTVFSDKPTRIITASASGQKGHEELQLILKTIQVTLSDNTCLLIGGVKEKID